MLIDTVDVICKLVYGEVNFKGPFFYKRCFVNFVCHVSRLVVDLCALVTSASDIG